MKVERERVEVIIYLGDFRVEGVIHLPPQGRLSDFINAPQRQFIPVTCATVYRGDSTEPIYKVELMLVSKRFISAIFPVEALNK